MLQEEEKKTTRAWSIPTQIRMSGNMGKLLTFCVNIAWILVHLVKLKWITRIWQTLGIKVFLQVCRSLGLPVWVKKSFWGNKALITVRAWVARRRRLGDNPTYFWPAGVVTFCHLSWKYFHISSKYFHISSKYFHISSKYFHIFWKYFLFFWGDNPTYFWPALCYLSLKYFHI